MEEGRMATFPHVGVRLAPTTLTSAARLRDKITDRLKSYHKIYTTAKGLPERENPRV